VTSSNILASTHLHNLHLKHYFWLCPATGLLILFQCFPGQDRKFTPLGFITHKRLGQIQMGARATRDMNNSSYLAIEILAEVFPLWMTIAQRFMNGFNVFSIIMQIAV